MTHATARTSAACALLVLALALSSSAVQLPATPGWTVATTAFSVSMAGAGDVNDDGIDDVIVGDGAGGASVYYGHPAGLSPTPDWTALSGVNVTSVACAGDVNDDGIDDVIVGAAYYNGPDPGDGGAFVFFGSAGGLSLTPGWTAEGPQPGAFFGMAVSGAGDMDGDGIDDVIVGAPNYTNGSSTPSKFVSGAAYTFKGGVPQPEPTGQFLLSDPEIVAGDYARFGTSVASAGDVNGDGFDDVVIGAPEYDITFTTSANQGKAFIYFGGDGGWFTGIPDWSTQTSQLGAQVGASVSGGDVNGDGLGDVVIGAPFYDSGGSDEGAVFVYFGISGGPPSTTPDWTSNGSQDGARFGASVSAGDFNGDGLDDIIVGAPNFSGANAAEGAAYLYYGNQATGLSMAADWSAEGDLDNAAFGTTVATAGDVTGIGAAGVLVRAPGPQYIHAYYAINTPPTLTPPGQFKRNGSTAIPFGAPTNQFGFVVKAQVSDFEGMFVRLQVEVKPVNDDFSGLDADIVTGAPVASGSEASVAISGLAANADYHWQVRGIDANNLPSAWISYGSDPDVASEVDFSTGAEAAPAATLPEQRLASGGSVIAIGGRVFENQVRFEALLTDGNDDAVRLEVEARPVGTNFSGTATASGLLVPSGQIATVAATLLSGDFHWQVRAMDERNVPSSSWTPFGGNGETAADFTIVAGGSTNDAQGCLASAPDGGSCWGALLLLLLPAIRRITP